MVYAYSSGSNRVSKMCHKKWMRAGNSTRFSVSTPRWICGLWDQKLGFDWKRIDLSVAVPRYRKSAPQILVFETNELLLFQRRRRRRLRRRVIELCQYSRENNPYLTLLKLFNWKPSSSWGSANFPIAPSTCIAECQ